MEKRRQSVRGRSHREADEKLKTEVTIYDVAITLIVKLYRYVPKVNSSFSNFVGWTPRLNCTANCGNLCLAVFDRLKCSLIAVLAPGKSNHPEYLYAISFFGL